VRDTVRAWVDDNLIPIIGEHYLEGRFPKQLVPQMAELGLFGANLPESTAAPAEQRRYGLIMQELERGDSGCARLPRCRARWRCIRSTPSARTSRSGAGFPRWRPAR